MERGKAVKALGRPGNRIYGAVTSDGLDAIDDVIKEANGDARLLQSMISTVPHELIRSGTNLLVLSFDVTGRAHVRLLSGQRKGRLLWVHRRMLQ